MLVAVAEKDSLRERGCRLASRMRDHASMVQGNVTVVESEGEDHGFHLFSPLRATSKMLMKNIVQFINHPKPQPTVLVGVPARPFNDVMGYGIRMKRWGHQSSSSLLQIGVSRAGHAGLLFSNNTPRPRLPTRAIVIPGSGTTVIKTFVY